MFWEKQEVFTHQSGYHGQHFKATMVTNKGELILSTLFIIIVDNVVRNWIALTVEDQLVAQEVLGLELGRCIKISYTDNGVVGLRDQEWLQGALNMLIDLFFQYRLVANVANSKAIAF